MKIIIFTSNAIRHKFVANQLAQHADDALVIVECKKNDSIGLQTQSKSIIDEHFQQRYRTETEMFAGNDIFTAPTLPILHGELNSDYCCSIIKTFQPDAAFVFGASILKEKILSLIPSGRFINLHLGLSPYYRGSGTNFWPFVNDELEYVGSTILHIDAGVDTGDIIAHVRPEIETGDNVHTVGCKVIRESAQCLVELMHLLKSGKELNRVKQWRIEDERYYRNRDFTEKILQKYMHNLEHGLIENHLSREPKNIELIPIEVPANPGVS